MCQSVNYWPLTGESRFFLCGVVANKEIKLVIFVRLVTG